MNLATGPHFVGWDGMTRLKHALGPLIAAALAASGCTPAGETDDTTSTAAEPASKGNAEAASWDLQSSDEGTALALATAGGDALLRLYCPAGRNRLVVNVRGFRPIGSEERMTFGSGDEAEALVADSRGDASRGGVTGEGPVPDDLKGLLGENLAVSYGAQTSGPHPPIPSALHRDFVTACFESAAQERREDRPEPTTNACLMQDGKRLTIAPLKATGTEPFWAARTEGRCVTYLTPENQKGTRVWTQFSPGPSGGVWSGALDGKPFVFRTEPVERCSDGMSGKIYPMRVRLTVGGEERRGCAEPRSEDKP